MSAAPTPPLIVVALGGNAVSPPGGDLSFQHERQAIDRAAGELAELAGTGARLLIVHGNGPQVGRLLAAKSFGDADNLDVHVAQTQGELGYLLAEGLDRHLGSGAAVAVVTRAVIRRDDPAFACPTKPVGAILHEPPLGVPSARVPDGSGWRRVVASPRPLGVVEAVAIGLLLERMHVVAGGGGGIPLVSTDGGRMPGAAVIDKDWIAALFAIELDAQALMFVTDVAHAFDRFGRSDQNAIASMTTIEARRRLADGVFAPGSMAPKIESAVSFVEHTGRSAIITTLGGIAAARRGASGTFIGP